MDSFFGIGAPELFVILILAGIVMGPHRIREAARWLGKFTTQFQAVRRSFMSQLNNELDAIDPDTLKEFRDLQEEMKSLRAELSQTVNSARQDGQAAMDEVKSAVDSGRALLQNGLEDAAPRPLPKPVDVPDDPA